MRVEVKRSDGQCSVCVLNQFDSADGPPNLNPDRLYRVGHALANIRERLNLVFGGRACLQVAVNGGDWVRVTVNVPVGETPA